MNDQATGLRAGNIVSAKIHHPAFLAREADYRTWLDLYQGGKAVEGRAEYLPRHPYETDRQYAIRLARSAYRNFAAPVVSVFASAVWRKAPVRVFAGEDTPPPELAPLLSDADGLGTTASGFFDRATRLAAAAGVHFVLVDQPRMAAGAATLAEERALGVRPYFVHVDALSLVDWGFAADGGLDYVVIRETAESSPGPFMGHENRTLYRVFTRQSWDLFREVAPGRITHAGERGEHNLGVVPLVPFYFEEEAPMVGRAAHADIAGLLRRIHWRDSELDKAQFDACVPVAVFSGFSRDEVEEFVRASSSGLVAENTEAKLTYAEPEGRSLERIRASILDDERSVREIALRMVRPDSRAAESAQAKRIDRAQLASRMAAFSRNLSRAEARCWELAALWQGLLNPRVTVRYNQDFDPEELAGDLAQTLLELARINYISRETAWEVLKAKEALPETFSPETEIRRLRQ